MGGRPRSVDLPRSRRDRRPRDRRRGLSLTSLHVTTFAELGLSDTLLDALRDVGYESPSPIQEQGSDDVVKDTGVDGDSIEVPARTVAVLVQPQA